MRCCFIDGQTLIDDNYFCTEEHLFLLSSVENGSPQFCKEICVQKFFKKITSRFFTFIVTGQRKMIQRISSTIGNFGHQLSVV